MEPVGSTSTIIARRFREAGVTPSKEIAGVLLSGILSDTLGLKMSTTTRNDVDMVAYLSAHAEVDAEEYAEELISEGMALAGMTQSVLLDRDTKEFTLSAKRVIIAQVLVPSYEYAAARKDEIYEALHEKLNEPHAPDMYIALYTSVSEMGSDMFAVAEDKLLASALHWDSPMHLPGVVSRKKDFVPKFGHILASNL